MDVKGRFKVHFTMVFNHTISGEVAALVITYGDGSLLLIEVKSSLSLMQLKEIKLLLDLGPLIYP